jgi:hypothetical protein
MKRILLFGFVGGVLLLGGCAITNYTYRMPMPESLEKTDMIAAIVSTLQDNGYSINTANEKLGLVTTEYKSLTGGFAKGFSMAMAGSADCRRIKVSCTVDSRTKCIKINPIVENIRESVYGVGAPSRVNMSDNEQSQIMKLSNEIADKISVEKSRIEIVQEQEQ